MRLGFGDPRALAAARGGRPRWATRGCRGLVTLPDQAAVAPTPTRRSTGPLGELLEAPSTTPRAARCSRRDRRRRGHRDAAAACWAPARRWATTSSRHPEQWRELTDPRWARPARRRTPCARRCCARSGPTRPTPPGRDGCRTPRPVDALRVEYRRVLLRLAARDLAHDMGVDDVAAELSDLAAAPSRRRWPWPGRGWASRRRWPGWRSSRWASAAATSSTTSPTSTSSSSTSRPREPTGRPTRPCGPPSQLAAHLMRICSEPHRARAPSGRSTPTCVPRARRPAGAHPRQPPGLLRALGQDLGVPGAAQGPPGRRRPRAGPGVRRDGRPDGVDAPPSARGSSTTSRRCGAGSSTTSPPRRPSGSSSSAPGGLRDVEFAVQLLQLVHGRADESIRAPDHAERAGRADPRRLRRPRGRRAAARRLRLPAHPRAPHAAAPAAAHPRGARGRPRRAAPPGPQHGLPRRTPWRELDQDLAAPPARGAPAAPEALLPPAARPRSPSSPASEARLSPEAARDRLAALGYADPRAALRHLEALTSGRDPHGGHPAHAAAGAAGVVRRRAPTPTPGCSASAGSARRWAQTPWYLTHPARRGPGRRAAGAAAGHLALRHRACSSASRRACGCWAAVAAAARRGGADRGDARGGVAPRRRREGGARGPCGAPPRAVPDRGRRPAGPHRRRARSAPGSRGSPTRRWR